MVPPENERDYISELEQGLKLLFGNYLQSYDLRQELSSYPLHTIGIFKPAAVVQHGVTYFLTVNIHIVMADYLKENGFNRRDLVIGRHDPTTIRQEQDLTKAALVLTVSYITSDFDDFLNDLKDATWGKYEKEFTKQLEVKLNSEDDS